MYIKQQKLIDNWSVLPTGTYPSDYIGLHPSVIYYNYYNDVLEPYLRKSYVYETFNIPEIINVNTPIVQEHWEIIPKEIFPKPTVQTFFVSSFGRLYNYDRDIIKTLFIRKDGYIGCGFSKFIVPMHRVVLYTFNPISNFQEMTTNHISMNVRENYLWNLEWCSIKENINKAISYGYRRNKDFAKGEDNSKATIKNYQAEAICRALCTGNYSNTQIAYSADTTKKIVTHIKNLESFRDIGEKYDVHNSKQPISKKDDTLIMGLPIVPPRTE